MRWHVRKKKRREPKDPPSWEWHPFFAWRPVILHGENVWLEWVERKITTNIDTVPGGGMFGGPRYDIDTKTDYRESQR